MRTSFLLLTLIALAGCDATGVFWPEGPPPWEKVDPYYYPDRNNLLNDRQGPRVDSVEACRAWVYEEAAHHGDANLERGDYECGVGHREKIGYINVYRLTVR